MRCPACRSAAVESDAACRQCGFTLEMAERGFGIPPALKGPVADPENVLGRLERRTAERAIADVERRYPQIGIAAVLLPVPPQAPLPPYAVWIFNRSQLSSAVERGGENRRVMFLIDLETNRAVAMVGYGLEPFIQDKHLRNCLNAALIPLNRAQYGRAIEAFVREFERQLQEVCRLLPQQYGLVDDEQWRDATQPLEDALEPLETLY
ncbi:MAG: TPM domain-containing protein [Prosthecobacter sp.]